MKQRVQHGTPDHGENLCDTCESATRRRGHRVSEVEVFCHALGNDGPVKVPYPIAECSAYRNTATSRPSMFYHTAWYYVPNHGFVPPDEHRRLVAKGKAE